MDPVASSCMRSPHPPAPGWGCLRNPHAEGSGASGLPHYPPTPFSFHQKPDFPATAAAAYPDFSASCLAATPHSLPREEHIFTEQHPAFPQPPDWNFPVSEARRRLNPGPAGGSREMGARSPGLMDTTGGPGEDYEILGSTAHETEKKSTRRKKESSGTWPRSGWAFLRWVCLPSLSRAALTLSCKQYYLIYLRARVAFGVSSTQSSRRLWSWGLYLCPQHSGRQEGYASKVTEMRATEIGRIRGMEPRCRQARAGEGFPVTGLPLGHASPHRSPAGSKWSRSRRICSPGGVG